MNIDEKMNELVEFVARVSSECDELFESLREEGWKDTDVRWLILKKKQLELEQGLLYLDRLQAIEKQLITT